MKKETLGDYLKHLRANRKLTLHHIEESTGISNAYMSQVENSKIKNPSAHVLWRLAHFLNGDFEHMLHLIGAINKSDHVKTRKVFFENLTLEEEKILRGFLTLIRSERDKLLQNQPNF